MSQSAKANGDVPGAGGPARDFAARESGPSRRFSATPLEAKHAAGPQPADRGAWFSSNRERNHSFRDKVLRIDIRCGVPGGDHFAAEWECMEIG